MTKAQLKAICKSNELTRQDARDLLRLLFDDNYNNLSQATNLHPFYLREMLCFIKPFSVVAQVAIRKASLEILAPKPKKTKAS